ncbi:MULTISPECIES: hypothetical protein [Niastella]|uniref:Lipoprotein n=1 Tax=Niastella soli TaxID=2821487 RepID=A0ABS3Z1G2_9BACT|nr:hypothetical protein [Niastella soli]MBO9203993.1 hypothetical protein [Niastella soli]
MRTYLFLSLLIAGCSYSSKHKGTELTFIEDVKSLVGKPVKGLRSDNISLLGESMIVKDTVLEDEGVSWNGAVLYYKQQGAILLESNWQDKEHVSRITLLDPLLKTRNGITIGSEYREILPVIDFKSWVNFPDGYIMFRDMKNPWIVYSMNTDSSAGLLNQPLDQKTIPGTLKVESIIVQ